MTKQSIRITLATPEDIAGILDLQERNLRSRGGALSVPFSQNWFERAITDLPIIVAHRGNRLVGYLVSCPMSAQMHVPIIQAMLRAYPGSSESYNYGPICVAESERGRDVASAMFDELRRRLPGREGIAFIRSGNTISRKAHIGMGMREVAEFIHDDAPYVVVAYAG